MTRNEQIIAAVEMDGLTYTQAAEKFGVTKNTVAGVLNRANVKVGMRPASVAAMDAARNTPAARKKRSEIARQWHVDNPDKSQETVDRMRAAALKWQRENPDGVARVVKTAVAARWSDPEQKVRHSERMKAFWAARKSAAA